MAQCGLRFEQENAGFWLVLVALIIDDIIDWKTRLNTTEQSTAGTGVAHGRRPSAVAAEFSPLSVLCRDVRVGIEHRQDLLASLGRQREYQSD